MNIFKKSLLLTLFFSIIFGAASAHIITGAAFFRCSIIQKWRIDAVGPCFTT